MNQNNTNMGMENDEITIDLMDLFQVVFKKLHLVLLAGIIAALVAVLVTKLFMTPVYTSTTKMYVLSKQDANSAVTSSDLQAGSQLTKDYMELIKSRSAVGYERRQAERGDYGIQYSRYPYPEYFRGK